MHNTPAGAAATLDRRPRYKGGRRAELMRAAILILGMAAQGGKGEGGAGVVAARMQLFPNDPALRWMQDLPPEMHVNDTNVPSFSTRENDALSPAKVHKSPRAATLDDTRKKKNALRVLTATTAGRIHVAGVTIRTKVTGTDGTDPPVTPLGLRVARITAPPRGRPGTAPGHHSIATYLARRGARRIFAYSGRGTIQAWRQAASGR